MGQVDQHQTLECRQPRYMLGLLHGTEFDPEIDESEVASRIATAELFVIAIPSSVPVGSFRGTLLMNEAWPFGS